MRQLKRILLVILVAALLTPVLSVSAESEDTRLRRKIPTDYYSALSASGKESLGGYCGLMTSWQLYFMGVNKYLQTNDGNKQYDYYCNREYTTGGHKITAYSAEDYTLEEALYAATDYGKRNAYNLIVGFEWTNTEAGATYGHAVVVYAILDGMVYFTEGFSTSFGTVEGQAIVLSIPRFVRYYHDWTIFEGLIEFGKKDYARTCTKYPADCYGVSSQPVELYSAPTTESTDDVYVQVTREVPAGERLHITALLQDPKGQVFCRVNDSGVDSYVPAQQIQFVCGNIPKLQYTQLSLPGRLEVGESFDMQLQLETEADSDATLHFYIVNEQGVAVSESTLEKKNGIHTLPENLVDFSKLPAGEYLTVLRICDQQTFWTGDSVRTQDLEELVLEQTFLVGDPQEAESQEPTDGQEPTDNQEPTDGEEEPAPAEEPTGQWLQRNGTWYYYKNGVPCTGWICDNGLDYYLNQDGSVTTGWATIHGKERFFGTTGVMRTGWMELGDDMYYLLSNGVPVTGWREVDGLYYFFDEDHKLVRNCWMEENHQKHYINIDGTAAAGGWYDLKEGRYFFDMAGNILAESVEENGQVRIRNWQTEETIRPKSMIGS